jgi:hypothetical protein
LKDKQRIRVAKDKIITAKEKKLVRLEREILRLMEGSKCIEVIGEKAERENT